MSTLGTFVRLLPDLSTAALKAQTSSANDKASTKNVRPKRKDPKKVAKPKSKKKNKTKKYKVRKKKQPVKPETKPEKETTPLRDVTLPWE